MNSQEIQKLALLYKSDGIDVSIRRVAETIQTSHTSLIRQFKTKESIVKHVYKSALREILQNAFSACGDTRLETQSASIQGMVLQRAMLELKRTGLGSISAQLWARESLQNIITDSFKELFLEFNQTGYSIHLNDFLGGENNVDVICEIVTRAALLQFLSFGGIRFLDVFSADLPDSKEAMELRTFQWYTQRLIRSDND